MSGDQTEHSWSSQGTMINELIPHGQHAQGSRNEAYSSQCVLNLPCSPSQGMETVRNICCIHCIMAITSRVVEKSCAAT